MTMKEMFKKFKIVSANRFAPILYTLSLYNLTYASLRNSEDNTSPVICSLIYGASALWLSYNELSLFKDVEETCKNEGFAEYIMNDHIMRNLAEIYADETGRRNEFLAAKKRPYTTK